MKKIGELLEKKAFRRNFYIVDFAILVMGILMLVWAYIFEIDNIPVNDTRAIIGSLFIVIWFALLPAISKEVKEKISNMILLHYCLVVVICLALVKMLEYMSQNLISGTVWGDILFAFGGVFIISYVIYVFVSFVEVFGIMVKKISYRIFGSLDSGKSKFMSFLETITALIVSITALGTSVVGFVTLANQILNLISK